MMQRILRLFLFSVSFVAYDQWYNKTSSMVLRVLCPIIDSDEFLVALFPEKYVPKFTFVTGK